MGNVCGSDAPVCFAFLQKGTAKVGTPPPVPIQWCKAPVQLASEHACPEVASGVTAPDVGPFTESPASSGVSPNASKAKSTPPCVHSASTLDEADKLQGLGITAASMLDERAPPLSPTSKEVRGVASASRSQKKNLQDVLASRRAVVDTAGESFEGGGATVTVDAPRLPLLPIALLFPNQGSEVVGMMADAYNFPPAAALLKRAQAVLGYDLIEVCSDAQRLSLPQFSHVALYVAELVAAERLRAEQPEAVEQCSAVAGIGPGEYAALVVAGCLNFEEGLKLVKVRAEAMHAAAEAAPCNISMLHVVGLQTSQVRALCEEAIKGTGDGSVCGISSILLPDNCTCAGTDMAIARLKVLAESSPQTKRKIAAKFMQAAAGTSAFQSSFMIAAREQLLSALSEVELRPPRCSVFFNSNGTALRAGSKPDQIANFLAAQLTSTILWVPAVEQMIEDGIQDFFELGPGRQLRTMMQRINSERWRRTKCIAP